MMSCLFKSSQWWNQDLYSSSLVPESVHLTSALYCFLDIAITFLKIMGSDSDDKTLMPFSRGYLQAWPRHFSSFLSLKDFPLFPSLISFLFSFPSPLLPMQFSYTCVQLNLTSRFMESNKPQSCHTQSSWVP